MNYYGTARSNYVHWIDPDAVKEILAKFSCGLAQRDSDGRWTIISNAEGGWYFSNFDENDNEIELDVARDLSPLLQEGEILVLMESGAEGHRYIIGCALAYSNKGFLCAVNLSDIYDKAHKTCRRRKIPVSSDHITHAEY